MKKRSFTSLLLSVLLLSLSVPTFAQSQQGGGKVITEKPVATTQIAGGNGVYTVTGATGGVAIAGGDGSAFTYVSSYGVNETLVKGQPMSAEAINESIQILADGNRIVRKSTTMIYRDSEGRSRREQTLSSVGQYASAGEPPRIISIYDPVAGVSYTLDARTKIARKIVFSASGQKDFNAGYATGTTYSMSRGQSGTVTVATADAAQKAELEAKLAKTKEKAKEKVATTVSGNAVVVADGVAQTSSYSGTVKKRERKEESLGKQTMEGVEAEGTRFTSTIPAGEIGNEQPINIVTERWYSPELKQLIYTKTSDPRFGETIYRLTNINRNEPNRSLFEVPTDYTIQEMPVRSVMREKMERENKEAKEAKEKTKKPLE